MKYFYVLLSMITFQSTILAGELQQSSEDSTGALKCEIIDESPKNIRCTYFSERVAYDRDITFIWRSFDTPHDDREHTIILKENHGSLYDYRYYYGRAQGAWDISITDNEGNTLAETSFILE